MQMDIPTHTDLAQLVNDNGTLGSVLYYRSVLYSEVYYHRSKQMSFIERCPFFKSVHFKTFVCA